MSFLVDTDVLSDPSKAQPSAKVEAWMEAHQALLYTSAITLGELSRGVELLPAGAKRLRMEGWLEARLEREGHKMPRRIVSSPPLPSGTI